jgi:membrane-bound metal-dependent hydrolase YbcI (DUF457 family)
LGRVIDELLRPSAYLLHMMNGRKFENPDRSMVSPDILISSGLYSCLLAASFVGSRIPWLPHERLRRAGQGLPGT